MSVVIATAGSIASVASMSTYIIPAAPCSLRSVPSSRSISDALLSTSVHFYHKQLESIQDQRSDTSINRPYLPDRQSYKERTNRYQLQQSCQDSKCCVKHFYPSVRHPGRSAILDVVDEL